MQKLCPVFMTVARGFLLLHFFQHTGTEMHFVFECQLNHPHGRSHTVIWDFHLSYQALC